MPGASNWFLPHPHFSSTFLQVLYLIFFIFLFNHGASGKPTNGTIDDTFGDSSDPSIKPLFLPLTNGVWEDASCKGCAIQPETSKAFRGTWTAATYNKGLGNVSVTLPFTGTAIHIFFILANDQGPGITTTTECNFTLDGQPAGNFVHKPTTSKALQYNESALVHSSMGLRNTKHELLISTSGVDHDVFVNFDYAIYTFDDSNPTSSSSSSSSSNSPTSNPPDGGSTSQSNLTAVVIGTILGGVAALAAAGLIIYFYCRRRKLERHFEGGGGGGVGVGGVESNHHPPYPPYPPTPGPIPIPPQTPPWNITNPNPNPSRASRALSDDMVSYIGQDNYTTLPTGEVVLSAATRPSQRYTVTSLRAPSGRPRTLVLHNRDRDRDSVFSTYPMPMSPATVNIQRTKELETQMQGIKREMRYLEVQAAEEGQGHEERGYGENKSLGEQLQEMREQVRMLQAQIQPPPGYTPT